MDHPLPPPSTQQLPVTARTTFKRHAERGSHERALIDAILDEALVAHVGVTIHGAPCVMPTAHVRVGDHVYLHGARANHVLVELCRAQSACLTVTLIDGRSEERRVGKGCRCRWAWYDGNNEHQ